MIDDATGKVLGGHFEPTECRRGYLLAMERMFKKHGIPESVYSDRHTIFFSPLGGKLNEEDELEGRKASLTQFGRMLYELGIEHIAAHSPQAKSRIERLWGTFQHRLVVELRLAGIETLADANEFLKTYVDKHNQRFARKAKSEVSAFLPCPREDALSVILSERYERVATGGSEISFEGVKYQLRKGKENISVRRGGKITVLRSVEGVLRGLYNNEIYELEKSPSGLNERAKAAQNLTGEKKERRKNIPAADHPWRSGNKGTKKPTGSDPIGNRTTN